MIGYISLYHGCSSHEREFFFFQAEDGIRDLVRSRGLGDVYKRQLLDATVVGHHGELQLLACTHVAARQLDLTLSPHLSLIHI